MVPIRRLRHRAMRAYWTTFVVLASYSVHRMARLILPDGMWRRSLQRLHIRNARRIERTLVMLGGLYIKIGQLVSVLTNFLPSEFRRELEGLQDSVPPHSIGEVRRRIQEELGNPPEYLFASFDPVPLASASLGQVHAAALSTGERVAVKVQYPDVEALVTADLRALRRITRIVTRYFDAHNVEGMVREIEHMVLEELDFAREADNLERIRANLASCSFVALPKVYRALSTQRVLTTELMEGVKVTELLEGRCADDGDFGRREAARRIIDAYCRQIFEHGLYHADPHPGNILIAPDRKIVLLDFGAVATLDDAMRAGLVELLQGFFTADTERILRALQDMGFVAQRGSAERIERIVTILHERLQSAIRVETLALQDIHVDPKLIFETLMDLRQMDVGLRELSEVFHVPSQWILLERTILMLAGVCTALDRELQPLEIIRPYVERMVLAKGEDWSTFALHTAKQLGVQFITLPTELRKVLGQASRGKLEFRAPALEAQARELSALGHQLVWASFTIAATALATVTELNGRSDLAVPFSWAAGGFGVLLFRAIVVHSRRPGK